ncbi:MAG: hypothetical protein KAG14_01145 [Mycoplasmataceae bacterium]|nr:hypothetical protein [Mycoplasmataceae bacterium]
MIKWLIKLLLPVAAFVVVAFIAWINIKYWNSISINIPDWAKHIMMH